MVIVRVAVTFGLTLTLLCPLAAAADPQTRSAGESSAARARLLDVPFVPQSEALCGGAAAAMMFRYWRSVPAYAEDFASLVGDSAEGISLGDLARAVRERGWRALPFSGTSSEVREHLAQGRPVIALIEDRPRRYHYVVVVAWATNQIVFHDPARGPFRVVAEQEFDRAWAVTNRTALLILPSTDLLEEASPTATQPASGDSCAKAVEEAVQVARRGDLEGAEALLSLADEACPSSSGAPRELAGIRFLQRRWDDAAALAERAIARDPSDMHAWQLLATARFLGGDLDGALRAWNSRDEPRVDLARVQGLDRTHYQVVSDLLNLPSQTLLTASHLERATRRIAELPALQRSRVTYSPRASGLATVEVAVVERPLVPRSWPNVAAAGLHAATGREVRLEVASPTGHGELWAGRWRWWSGRPGVSLSVATPRLGRWSGLWRLDGTWERETYRLADTLVASDRRRAAVTFGDWRSGDFRWEVSGALENWNGIGKHLSAGAAVERRLLEDDFAVRLNGALWPAMGAAMGFGSAGVSAAWRSGARSGDDLAAWTMLTGLYTVSKRAPFDVWPATDTGHLRSALLRAHPLLEQGAIRASALGRVLAHVTLEFQRDLASPPFLRVRWAAFVDAAKQGRMLAGFTRTAHVDIGAGLRAQLPGAPGTLRVDIARGIGDGRMALSAAWQPAWPGW
jgi:hypothetical protein